MRYNAIRSKKIPTKVIKSKVISNKTTIKYLVIEPNVFKLVKTANCSGFHVQNVKTQCWLKIIVRGIDELRLVINNKK